jgi:hypothetical protein
MPQKRPATITTDSAPSLPPPDSWCGRSGAAKACSALGFPRFCGLKAALLLQRSG